MTALAETIPDFRIDARTAIEAVRNGALFVDVRSAAGRGQNGELQGAAVISKADALDVLTKRIGRASPEQKVVVFCGSIKGSEPIVQALIDAGERNVFDVDGGFSALVAAGASVIPR